MGVLDLFRSRVRRDPIAPAPITDEPYYLHPGDDDLEIVGEASYQDHLWRICGGWRDDRVRYAIVAVLVPEDANPHDVNAVAIHVEGVCVGYLSRDDAISYRPGIQALMARTNGWVALRGVIVGGGQRRDGRGMLGVWLDHDPTLFGLPASTGQDWTGPTSRPTPSVGAMRTGFTEAWRSDVEDDSYDLSWFSDLPDADMPAIMHLRQLLETDPDPIDRHFQFAELASRLYKSRDLFASALDEFDDVCARHDAEMDGICDAFRAKWGKVPLLETYKQMAIRKQKQRDWTGVLWWVERGLALYGDDAARVEAIEDLLKRRNRATAKLESDGAA